MQSFLQTKVSIISIKIHDFPIVYIEIVLV